MVKKKIVKRSHHKKPIKKESAKKEPAKKEPIPPQPQPVEQKVAYEDVVVSAFKLKIVDVIEPDQSKAKNSAEIKNGTSTQSVNQKLRLDCTPVDAAGKDYPGNSPVVNSPAFYKEDGTSPIIEYRWFVDGREASNSAQMPDPFHLGSYEDNGGCTPTLKLLEQVGEGRHQVNCHAFVRAEYNGGKEVQSPVVTWFCD